MATTSARPNLARAATIVERSPGVVPATVVVGVLLWFAGDEAGFNKTTWMPAALLLGAVLIVGLASLPAPRPSRPALAAILLLTGYGVLCLLSMLWADQEELAWDASNRVFLYALVLALCSLWPLRDRSAGFVLGGYGLGVAVIALVELLKAAGAEQGVQYFAEGRFAEPAGYANANVALWMSGLLPCVILAARQGVPALLRGAFLGGAGLLAGAALLGQSRGWAIVLPLVALVALLVVPGRARTIAALAAVGLALLAIVHPLLDVYSSWKALSPPGPSYDNALRDLLLASAALAVLGTLAALVDRRVQVSERTGRRIGAAAVVAVALAAVGAVGVYAAVERNPVSAASDALDEFTEGGSTPSGDTNRLSSGFSTYRYDYWRVAWQEFKQDPLLGAGADNFARAYQVRGKSDQTPAFPHSTEMAALAETGLLGALLLGAAFVCALVAAAPALRRPGLGGAAAGAGVLMFGYWLIHGSIDWFWEFPGLAGPALAGLGVAIAVARGAVEAEPVPRDSLLSSRLALAAAVAGALLLVASVVPPWLSERAERRGTSVAASDPGAALEHFERAADLNPLTPIPYKAAAIVQIRNERYDDAERSLRLALERDEGDSGLHLLLGVLASNAGRRQEAVAELDEAHRLAPLDGITSTAWRRARRGRKLDPQQVDRLIRSDLRQRIGRE